jgi:3-hydroxyisobutyrate dehydrogenase-like beta-hydroxyacid dehydrogenase
MRAAREKTVGFVGLGAMGGPMATNILKAGHMIIVYDVNPAKNETLKNLGAEVADCPAQVAQDAHVLISMVDTTAQAEQVILGPDGFIEGARAGDVVISMSTIDPLAVQRMQERLKTKGIEIIDAPVTGMIDGAERGALNAYVGGSPAALEKARFALEPMTDKIHHIGPQLGQGLTFKLINNMLAQAGRVLVLEAMVLGAKAGIDPERIIDLVKESSGNSVVFQHAAPRTLSRDFSGIRLDITLKDMELESQLGKSLGVPLFMLNTAYQVNMMGKAAGLGGEDPAAVVKVYERLTGVSLAKT